MSNSRIISATQYNKGVRFFVFVCRLELSSFHKRKNGRTEFHFISVSSRIPIPIPALIRDLTLYIYQGFIAFSSIGYGDYAPATPAGRSVFVVWALLGAGAMTVLVSGTLFKVGHLKIKKIIFFIWCGKYSPLRGLFVTVQERAERRNIATGD